MATTGWDEIEPPRLPVAMPRAPFVVLVLAVVIGGVLGILLLNTKINENAFVLYELRQEQAALDQRQQQLEQEVAQAQSTAQLAAAARRMGLVDLRDELVHLQLPDADSAAVEDSGNAAGQAEG
jgi:cell division protein FtsB